MWKEPVSSLTLTQNKQQFAGKNKNLLEKNNLKYANFVSALLRKW
jgi:hypothetical protein